MSDIKKIRFAVAGCGHIGKRHATMVVNNKECELIGLCDIRSDAELGIPAFGVPF